MDSKAIATKVARLVLAVGGDAGGGASINFANKVFLGDLEPGFMIDLAHKDLSLIMTAAAQGKVPLPMVAAARESVSLARAQGWGRKDFSALADFWCDLAAQPRARLPRRDGTG